MNRAFLVGNLTRDPELRQTQTGKNVVTFTLAVNRQFSDQADFLNVVAWEKLAELCNTYLRKGSKVAAIGNIQTRSYEKDGQKRTVYEIVAEQVEFLDRKKDMTEVEDGFMPF